MDWNEAARQRSRLECLMIVSLMLQGHCNPDRIDGNGLEMTANEVAGLLTQMGFWCGMDKSRLKS